MGSGVWVLRCRQVICKGCRTKTTLGIVPITKLWFTPSDKAISKALHPEVAFPHSQVAACPAAVWMLTQTQSDGTVLPLNNFSFLTVPPGCEGSRQVPCWHHWSSGQHKGWCKTEHTQTHALQPQSNTPHSLFSWKFSLRITQFLSYNGLAAVLSYKVLSSLLFTVTPLTSAALVRPGANNTKTMGLTPVWPIHLRAALNDACGSLPIQNIAWKFDINITVWLILLPLLWKL